ncbi:MAG: hypothetical protein H6808_08125 [Phycisphaera sp.]|nr:hypothetical protein [Phycisphaera sp.]
MSASMSESYGKIRRLSAGVMGLAGFVVALLSGLQAGNETSRVIVIALLAMVVCHIVGVVLGLVIERVVEEHKQSLEKPNSGQSTSQQHTSDQSPRLAA